jgi:hypothetical protein
MDRRWVRWITASVIRHFGVLLDEYGIPNIVEGQRRLSESDNFVELRIDGPYFTESTKGSWLVEVEVNILIQHGIDTENFYGMKDVQGAVSMCFVEIPLRKFGDDNTVFGCLRRRNETAGGHKLTISNFGKIEPELMIQQATIEGHYHCYLTA